jgi:signal transduction histidine kinase
MHLRGRRSSPGRQRIGIALLLPVVLGVPYVLLGGAVRAPLVVWATVAVVLVAALLQVRWLWHGSLPRPSRTTKQAGLLAGVLVGVVALVPTLTVGLQVADVAVFAVVVAVLLVVQVQAFVGWQRWVLVCLTAGLWGWLLGSDELPVLLLHSAGAVVLVVGTARIADGLAEATAAAARERRRAEQRATVLAEVLRARSLEPAEVYRAVLRGLDAVGFDVAVIRRVDTFAGRAVIVADLNHLPVELEADSRTDLGLLGVAIQERREVVVDDVGADPRAIDRGEGFLGGIALPLFDRGEVVATIEATLCSGPLDPNQLAAVRQLGVAAERALVRARSFATDRRLVRELDRLHARTEAFVAASAEGVAAPMQALRADLRLLWARAGELDEEQRAAAVRRIDAHARQLNLLVRTMVDDAAVARSRLDIDLRPGGLYAIVAGVTDRMRISDPPVATIVEVAPELTVAVDRPLAERLVEELVTAVAAHGSGAPIRVSARRDGDRVWLMVRGSNGQAGRATLVPAERGPAPAIAAGASGWSVRLPSVGVAADEGEEGQLSLAIARQIARAHGSELSVHRPTGRPATLRCSLPVAS